MGDEEGKRSSRYATAQKAQISEKMGVLYACRFPRKTMEWSFRAARAGGTIKRKKLESCLYGLGCRLRFSGGVRG